MAGQIDPYAAEPLVEREVHEQRDEPMKTVWLFGAGASRFLGGPLFTDFFSAPLDSWVDAWLADLGCIPGSLAAAKPAYEGGKSLGFWSNPEQCLAELHYAARSNQGQKRHEGILRGPIEDVCRQLSQYLAIATSAFVDRVVTERELPENWQPYLNWMNSLSSDDVIVSFNYDLVVENLKRITGRDVKLIKLHGSVPPRDELVQRVKDNVAIGSILMPGPAKLAGSKGPNWDAAAEALRRADLLVVLGYSFPQSDPVARNFILKHCKSRFARVVLGSGSPDAHRVTEMFRRVKPLPTDEFEQAKVNAKDTGLSTEEYFAEGTTGPDGTRFRHV